MIGATLAAAAFYGGTVLAPVLDAGGAPTARLLRLGYAPLCHQKTERSMMIGARPQAVCARCSGLYLGGVLGLAATLGLAAAGRRGPRPFWLLAWTAPTLLDVALGVAGLPSLPNLPRLVLALPPGFVLGRFLAVALADAVCRGARLSFDPVHPAVTD